MAKLGLQFSEPMTFLAIRFGAVVIIMMLLFLLLRPPLPETLREWMHLAVVGLLLQSVYFGFCYLAFTAGVAAGTAALLMSLQPVLVGLIAPSWSGERISWFRWSGLLLGLTGAAIVILARSSIETPTLFGLACAVIGLIGITAGSLWEKRFGLSHHPVSANLIGYTAGLLGILPILFLTETMQVNWTVDFMLALTYLVIGNSVIAVGLLLAMIRAGDVSRVSALFFLVPPFAALIAWFVLGEQMPPLAWVGMLVAAVGVFISTRN